ncbi:glyoxalase/bleomycin resistance/extradiol dioxygenase family protein [Terriglobus sp. TAA 43]|uniref:VOC family protein n=1 Tax=Terriglobus sp. TAA 43 TaxID=278961 RepID=UPI000646559B|nr:VOC family protein [Terriglobus sp. TAA 43]
MAMDARMVVMLHVPDVIGTASWYAELGFTVHDIGRDGDEAVWALLSWRGAELTLSAGGHPPQHIRRSADLYIHTEDVDGLFDSMRNKAEVVEDPHDTFYGQREFILRDCNGFWITFGEPARKA